MVNRIMIYELYPLKQLVLSRQMIVFCVGFRLELSLGVRKAAVEISQTYLVTCQRH